MTTAAALRRAAPRDAFAVAALHLQSWRERDADPEPGFLDRWADAWLADAPARPFWLAEAEGRPVGVAGLHVVADLPAPGQEGVARWAASGFLFVTASFRRRGIGAQLTRAAVAWSSSQGLDRVVLDLGPLGPAAPGIGRRLGPTRSTGVVVEARDRRAPVPA